MIIHYINIKNEYIPNLALCFNSDDSACLYHHWFVVFDASKEDIDEIKSKLPEKVVLIKSEDEEPEDVIYLVATNDDEAKLKLDNILTVTPCLGL